MFTVDFHKKSGTLDQSLPANVIELFNSKSTRINADTVQFLRDRFTDQERLLRYFKHLHLVLFNCFSAPKLNFTKPEQTKNFFTTIPTNELPLGYPLRNLSTCWLTWNVFDTISSKWPLQKRLIYWWLTYGLYYSVFLLKKILSLGRE